MVRIALIEDDKELLRTEAGQLQEAWRQPENMELRCFASAEEFLGEAEALKEAEKPFDILVTDIELPGMSGIDMVRLLREQKDQIYTIFLTVHASFALESYYLEAEQYVLKEHLTERMEGVLNRVGRRVIENRSSFRMVTYNGELCKMRFEEVFYFRKEKQYIHYITADGTIKVRESIEKAESEMGGFPFVKIERGYVMNARDLKRISANTAYMDNGDMLPISRRMLPQVKRTINLNRDRL